MVGRRIMECSRFVAPEPLHRGVAHSAGAIEPGFVERQLVYRERGQPEGRIILEVPRDPRSAVLVRTKHASVAAERIEQKRRALDRDTTIRVVSERSRGFG